MPRYTIEAPDGRKITIEAGDQATALRGAQEWAKANPKKLSIGDHVEGALSKVNRAIGVGDEIAGALRTGENALLGKIPAGKNIGETLSNVRKDFDQSMATQRAIEDRYTRQAPISANLAAGTGNALTMFVPAGKTAQALGEASRLTNMARGAVTAGLTAAGYAALDKGTASERLAAASRAVRDPITLGLGAAAGALSPARRAAPKRQIDPDVIALREKGVDLTPGQAAGGVAKAAEDAATSLPILGTSIQEARKANLGTFNQAVANEALKPISKRVPAGVAPGNETTAFVERAIGAEYDKLIPSGGVRVDDEMGQALGGLTDIVQTLQPKNQRRLEGILNQRLVSRMATGELDGPMYQRVQSELKREAQRFSGSNDPDYRAMGEAIGGVSEALRDAAARQNPAFAARKAKVDRAWAEFKRLQGATVGAGSASEGVFTPAQYYGAVKRADKSLDKGRLARGDAIGQDFGGAASRVLPSQIPDSGTATRGSIAALAAAPSAIASGFATGGPIGALTAAGGVGATVGGLKLASKAYSPQAIAAFNKVLDERISAQEARAALAELAAIAQRDPKAQALYQEAATRLARTIGVSREAARPQNALLPANPGQ